VLKQVKQGAVSLLLGNSPAFEFRHPGITQHTTYNIQNMAKVWNQENRVCLCCWMQCSCTLL